jgi:hypothetical protein
MSSTVDGVMVFLQSSPIFLFPVEIFSYETSILLWHLFSCNQLGDSNQNDAHVMSQTER